MKLHQLVGYTFLGMIVLFSGCCLTICGAATCSGIERDSNTRNTTLGEPIHISPSSSAPLKKVGEGVNSVLIRPDNENATSELDLDSYVNVLHGIDGGPKLQYRRYLKNIHRGFPEKSYEEIVIKVVDTPYVCEESLGKRPKVMRVLQYLNAVSLDQKALNGIRSASKEPFMDTLLVFIALGC